MRARHRLLCLAGSLTLLVAASASAAPVGAGAFRIDIDGQNGLRFTGPSQVDFDNATYNVFGTLANVSAVGTMTTTGQLLTFDPVVGGGTFTSTSSTATLTIETTNGTYRCRDKTGTVKSSCAVIGDLSFFSGTATLSGSFAATLPPGLTYTVDGTGVFTSGVASGVRTSKGRFTLSAFQPTGACCSQPCEGNPALCNSGIPGTVDACHPVRGCVHTTDQDGDGVFDDGDGSGVIGDNPCLPGQIVGCDDNCPKIANRGQEDFDGDGLGDACDDADGDGLLDEWELRGLPGVNLPAMGANPLHKDLFIQADWMDGYSCQIMRCKGGAHPDSICRCKGDECDADIDDCAGSPCVSCTCPETCGTRCPAGAEICRGADEVNGNDCTCSGSAAECADTAHCGPDGRCVYHSHNPRRAACQAGAKKGDACTSGADCDGSPCMSAVDMVAHVFEIAPVSNPDDSPGIALHVDTGELGGGRAIPHQENLENQLFDWTHFERIKSCNFDFARAPVFRYGVFAHDESECAGSIGGISRSVPSNDFLVVGGSWLDEEGRPGSTVDAVAATFLHEFGHNLGLGHGGFPNDYIDPNFKPNYLSIMNYLYPVKLSGRLDYSRKKLPNPGGLLDEHILDEMAGIPGTDPGDRILYHCPAHTCASLPGTACQCPDPSLACSGDQSTCVAAAANPIGYCGCFGVPASGSGPIDWDCDGVMSPTPVQADINQGAQAQFSAFVLCPLTGPPTYEVLRGFNDWQNLDYSPRDALDYDTAPAVSCVYQTYENYRAVPLPSLPVEVCDGLDNDGNGQVDEGYDRDGDGVADCFDNCPDVYNPGQADADRDGAGDACDPQPLPVPFALVDLRKMEMRFGTGVGTDQLHLRANLTLGAQSDGIFPPGEPVTIALADPTGEVFSQTLPTGAFVNRKGSFTFGARRGRLGIVGVRLAPDGVTGRKFKIALVAKGIDLLRLRSSPVTLRLIVGDDIGAQTVPCAVYRTGARLICRG